MSDTGPSATLNGSVDQEGRTAKRSGSFMSDRQIGQAAARGRRVTFRWLSTQPAHEISGYIVGMDHYHWMVATVTPQDLRVLGEVPVEVTLVHKARVDMIRIPNQSTIDTEEPGVQAALTQIGQGFWRYCETTHAGR